VQSGDAAGAASVARAQVTTTSQLQLSAALDTLGSSPVVSEAAVWPLPLESQTATDPRIANIDDTLRLRQSLACMLWLQR